MLQDQKRVKINITSIICMITLTPQRVQLELVGSQETQLLQTPGTKKKKPCHHKYKRSTSPLDCCGNTPQSRGEHCHSLRANGQ